MNPYIYPGLRDEQAQKRYMNLERLAELFEAQTGFTHGMLKSKTRAVPIVKHRHAFCYYAKHLTDATLAEIGLFVGFRDHSTVIHAVHSVNEQRAQYPKYAEWLHGIHPLGDVVLPSLPRAKKIVRLEYTPQTVGKKITRPAPVVPTTEKILRKYAV